MSPNVEQVKQTIQRLPAGDVKELFDWFEEYRPLVEDMPLRVNSESSGLLKRLLDKGLISEISPPMTDEEDEEFVAIEIGGEPLSELILRERR